MIPTPFRLFLLPDAKPRDTAVSAWFSDAPEHLRTIARTWFERLRNCGDDIQETMHDGCAVACVGTAAFAYIGVYKHHVNLGFYCGSALPDPQALLQGSGKYMRHVKLSPDHPVDEDALQGLILTAYRITKTQLPAEVPTHR